MKRQKLDKLMQAIACRLSWHEHKALQDELAALQGQDAGVRAIEALALASCPSCQGTHIVKNGMARYLQCYLRRSCGRTFSALSDGLSIPQAARRLGIVWNTAFRWRHRFLQWSSQLQTNELVGIAEADESYFLDPSKGERGLLRKARRRGGKANNRGLSKEQVAALMVRDRSGAPANLIVERTTAAQLSQALAPMLPTDTVLCTDGSPSLAAAADLLGVVQHRSVNVSADVRVDGPWHVQNLASRLRGWLLCFKDVATKCLTSYLGWFRMLDGAPDNTPEPTSVQALAITG